MRLSSVVYANAYRRINSLDHFSLFENICVFIKQASLGICNSFPNLGGGGVDNYILWLSFAHQKVY
jgi:hypothetical protein